MTDPSTEPDQPDAQAIRKKALALLHERPEMTLATADDNGPWAAPVYFVRFRSGLYFLSAPDSRHIVQALASGRVAAAVYEPSWQWREIRGLQISGDLVEVPAGARAAAAMVAYLRKFPFVKEMLGSDRPPDLGALARRFRVRLYKLNPREIWYRDNAVRFGFCCQVQV